MNLDGLESLLDMYGLTLVASVIRTSREILPNSEPFLPCGVCETLAAALLVRLFCKFMFNEGPLVFPPPSCMPVLSDTTLTVF